MLATCLCLQVVNPRQVHYIVNECLLMCWYRIDREPTAMLLACKHAELHRHVTNEVMSRVYQLLESQRWPTNKINHEWGLGSKQIITVRLGCHMAGTYALPIHWHSSYVRQCLLDVHAEGHTVSAWHAIHQRADCDTWALSDT